MDIRKILGLRDKAEKTVASIHGSYDAQIEAIENERDKKVNKVESGLLKKSAKELSLSEGSVNRLLSSNDDKEVICGCLQLLLIKDNLLLKKEVTMKGRWAGEDTTATLRSNGDSFTITIKCEDDGQAPSTLIFTISGFFERLFKNDSKHLFITGSYDIGTDHGGPGRSGSYKPKEAETRASEALKAHCK